MAVKSTFLNQADSDLKWQLTFRRYILVMLTLGEKTAVERSMSPVEFCLVGYSRAGCTAGG